MANNLLRCADDYLGSKDLDAYDNEYQDDLHTNTKACKNLMDTQDRLSDIKVKGDTEVIGMLTSVDNCMNQEAHQGN